jgi:hypothetical protein
MFSLLSSFVRFLYCAVVTHFDDSEERTASIYRVTELVSVDVEAIQRNEICLACGKISGNMVKLGLRRSGREDRILPLSNTQWQQSPLKECKQWQACISSQQICRRVSALRNYSAERYENYRLSSLWNSAELKWPISSTSVSFTCLRRYLSHLHNKRMNEYINVLDTVCLVCATYIRAHRYCAFIPLNSTSGHISQHILRLIGNHLSFFHLQSAAITWRVDEHVNTVDFETGL